MSSLETLSFSSISGFAGYASCRREWFYKRVEKAEPDRKKGLALAVGNAFDAGAKAIMDAKIEGEIAPADMAIEAGIEQWHRDMESEEYALDGEHGSNLPGLLPAALRRFTEETAPNIVPIATQHPVRIAFEEVPWELVAKIDLIAESADIPGYEDVLDTKATTSSSTTYEPAADLQLNLYDLARTLEGARVANHGFILARVLKTKAEIRHDIAPSSQDARDQTLELLGDISGEIESALDRGNFPPTAFLQRHWKCSEKFCDYYPKTCPYGARARTTFSMPGGDDDA